jgi:hypothetical protein
MTGETFLRTFLNKDVQFYHLMPDDIIKKLPKFGYINIWTGKVLDFVLGFEL